MESDFTPQQALAEAERASVSPWIDYPPTPWWYYPAVAGWGAGFLLASELPVLWRILAYVVLVGVGIWFVRWMKAKRGAWPSVTKPPAEFNRAIRGYMAGTAVLVGAVGAALALVGPYLGAAVLFVGATGGLYVYEKAYERAAEATRTRVGTTR